MIFTTKAEYGVRLLIQLGRHGNGHPVSLKAIAEAENLPLAYCERIAALLKKADLVVSTRGAHGGYVLARPAEEITMDQAVLALEGAIAPMDCFLDDHDGRVQCSHGRGRRDVRDQAAVDARADGRHPLAAAHDARGARRFRVAPRRACGRFDFFFLDRDQGHMGELQIKNLHVSAGDKQILKGVDLHVRAGEFHALMGPNGSGKSTLANVIMGHPNLEVTEGQIIFDGEDITEADPDERARAGLFMAFQYPVAIPGVTVAKYLRMVMNAHREAPRRARDLAEGLPQDRRGRDGAHAGPARVLQPLPQRRLLRRREEAHGDPPARAHQAALAVLDETDSGLDIDALNTVAAGVNTVAEGTDMGVLIITHYQRILHMVKPQFVHIMFEGRIVKEGGPELVSGAREEGLRLDSRRGRGGVPDVPRGPHLGRVPDAGAGGPRLPRHGGHGADRAAGDRGDGPLLRDLPGVDPPRHLRDRHRGDGRLRGARDEGRRVHGLDARRDDLHPQRHRGDQPRGLRVGSRQRRRRTTSW